MELSLIENTRQTRIKVSKKEFPYCKAIIEVYNKLYGVEFEKSNSRYIYYIVNADLLNKQRG